MPAKKKVDLTKDVKDAVRDRILLSQDASENAQRFADAADENFKIDIYLAVEQGMTTYEIGELLGKSQSVVSKWRIAGEQARDRRRSLSADGPGER